MKIENIIEKKEEINSWTKTPEMPTSPKLIALLGNILKVMLWIIETRKSHTIAISNFELPNLLPLKVNGTSFTFKSPLLKASNSYKNLNPLIVQ